MNALVVGGFALPGLVIALALVFWVLGTPVVRGLYQSYPLLVFAYVVHFGAQALRASQVAVSGLPPRVEDAARALGAGRWRRLRDRRAAAHRRRARGRSRTRAPGHDEGAPGHPAPRAHGVRDPRDPDLERVARVACWRGPG